MPRFELETLIYIEARLNLEIMDRSGGGSAIAIVEGHRPEDKFFASASRVSDHNPPYWLR